MPFPPELNADENAPLQEITPTMVGMLRVSISREPDPWCGLASVLHHTGPELDRIAVYAWGPAAAALADRLNLRAGPRIGTAAVSVDGPREIEAPQVKQIPGKVIDI